MQRHGRLATWLGLLLLAFVLPMSTPQIASAEPLAGLADCPDCATDSGGGAVVDFYQELNQGGSTAIQDPDPAGTNFVSQASNMVGDLSSEPAGTISGAAGDGPGGEAAQSVWGSIADAGEAGGVLDPVAALAAAGTLLVGPTVVHGYVKLGTLVWDFLFGSSAAAPSTTFSGQYTLADAAYASEMGFALRQGTTAEGNPWGTAKWNPDCVQGLSTPGLCTTFLWGIAGYSSPRFDADWDEGSPGAPPGANVRWWWGGRGTWQNEITITNAQLMKTSLGSIGAQQPPAGATVAQAQPQPEPGRSQLVQTLDNALSNDPEAQKWLEHELNPRCNPDPATTAVVVPSVRPDESVGGYEQCLSSLGLSYAATTLSASDPDTGTGAVAETFPEEGAIVRPRTTVQIAVNPDSPTISQPDPRCDLDNGSDVIGDPGDPPSDGTNFPEYQLVQGSPYRAAIDPTGSSPPEIQVPLRWGTKRWGWRHILQKHSFSSADQTQTMQTLANDSTPTPTRFVSTNQWDFHETYSAPDGAGGTITCVRTVRVEYVPDSNATAAGLPGIRGIQNSFTGLYLGGLPGH